MSPRVVASPLPPPHDPAERVLVTRLDGWQVRDFGYDDIRVAYFAARGISHFQLWHPVQRVSVLTPSRLTDDQYEVFPVQRWKRRALSWREMADVLRSHHALEPPSESCLRALERWFLRPPELPDDGTAA